MELSSFQHRRHRRVILRVADADEQLLRLARFKQLLPIAVQHHERLAGFLSADFHVAPAELRADAGAKGNTPFHPAIKSAVRTARRISPATPRCARLL